MSKIVCDVCGTSYSDNSAQCPICGYVPSENAFQENGEVPENGAYTYEKGGRFSKNNVRKRVKNNPVEEIDEYGEAEEIIEDGERRDTPLIVIAVILLLAIAAVVLFITMRYFNTESTLDTEPETIQQTTVAQTTDDGVIECSKLEVSATQISIPEGGTYELTVICEPAETTDELFFESMDPEIAQVDKDGVITPVKTGTTKIIVTCGQQKIEVTVSCEVAQEEVFMLTRMELEFTAAGETWELYAGSIPLEEISFSCDDEQVVTIDDKGVVTAVGEGQTVVYGKYGDQTVSCNVSCVFEEKDTQVDDGGISEDGGVSEDSTQNEVQSGELMTEPPKATGIKGYKIKTNFGEAYVSQKNPALFDIGHYIGYDITLRLVDGNGNRINATWTVFNTSICKQKVTGGSEFSCLAEGKAFAVATTDDGETYVCIIRVTPYPG